MDSQERFENMVGLVEAHQYEWAIWQAAERQGTPPRESQPDSDVIEHKGQNLMQLWFECGRDVFVFYDRIIAPTPERAQPINQCDGCQVKAPMTEQGNHAMPDGGYMGCTADRYATDYEAMEREHFGDSEKQTGIYAPERAQESAGVRLTDDQFRRIWMLETGTTEQDSPLAILDFARAVESAVLAANKEPQP